ncbi:Maf family protein [Aliiroseovarius lamellibrachiae]|uniref:Maf family protein n=1 Tax=Aliiroseovarius lamellibrachiae TaxID=1924933 RepID=UPI001BE03B49|nr:Maf family nucleotide pyrophosphatase [Aliiroseovarius lamellibrachiae]MBT2131803.1 septum formation protein Maf [Aliiroseovarius lamellibrachiae]
MTDQIILASGSDIRAQLLRNAGVNFDVIPARIDEDMIKTSLKAEGASSRDLADALAEFKARKISEKHRDALVLGCDQVADLGGEVMSKPRDADDAIAQLTTMSGMTHRLFSAAVLYKNGEPLWRHVGMVRLKMRELSTQYIADYVDRNWDSIRHSVGGYKLEEEGVRLFAKVDGDYFNVLGLPLTELLSYLITRGELDI